MKGKNKYKWVLIEDPKLKNIPKERLKEIFNKKLARVIIQQESNKVLKVVAEK